MARVLKEYFDEVHAADAYRYGYGLVRDFLTYPYETNAVDWAITNPPFRLAEEFVLRAPMVARCGLAMDADREIDNYELAHPKSKRSGCETRGGRSMLWGKLEKRSVETGRAHPRYTR